MQGNNLNGLSVPDYVDSGYARLTDCYSVDGATRVFFDHLQERLIEEINKADCVFGCVAWLTNEAILDALALKSDVSIVVQKEDFLRPDIDLRNQWSMFVRGKYSRLQCGFSTYDFTGTVISSLNQGRGYSVDPVRCVGNHNADKNPAFPRSHHKFVVFCRETETTWESESYDTDPFRAVTEELPTQTYVWRGFEPYAVWTGSFNFTMNATRSFENAVLMTDKNIVDAYMKEFGHIYALSEELDWESDWVRPEYYIGT